VARIMLISVNRMLKYRKYRLTRRFATELIRLFGVELPLSVKLGKDVYFGHNAIGTVIHNNTTIEDNVKIYQNVTLGRADIHIPWEKSKMKGIVVKEGAILCAGAKILCKEGILTIGKNSVVAANAVLLNSIGDNEIWGGIPAKKIGNVEISA
jgi:serine O-acetyltransferase